MLLGCAAVLACAVGCSIRPPTHALVVRNPQAKCALIAFSGCAALLGNGDPAHDEDAGLDDLAHDEDAGVE